MKKYLIGFIVGALVVSIGGHFYTNYKISKWKQDAIDWHAKYDQQKQTAVENEIAGNKIIERQEQTIAELQGNVDSLMTVNANLETERAGQIQQTAAAEAHAAALTAEIQPVLDANPKVREAFEAKDVVISSLKAENFTLRQQRENDQKIIFNLTEKYEAQVRISEERTRSLVEYKGLLVKAELRVSLVDKRVAALQKQAGLKSVLTVAAGVGLILSFVF